jgi:uncharacterized repeat protein (TIGR02543 family)
MKHNDTVLRFVHYNGNFVKIWEHDGSQVFFSGAEVTYVVDGAEYKEFVNYGQSCLSPTVVAPVKSGWEFAGWRKDTVASGSVETSVVMNTEPITLYAVFKQELTETFISYNDTQTLKGNMYYNNGNTKYAQIAIPIGADYAGWNWRGWSKNTSANAEIQLVEGHVAEFGTSNTYYGRYDKTITVTYSDMGTTNGKYTGTRYYNAAGEYKNPSFTLRQYKSPYWDEIGWTSGTSATASITYNNAEEFTRESNITLYGIYHQNITLTTVVRGNPSKVTRLRAYNSAGEYSNPRFTVPNPTESGADFQGWSWDGSTNIANSAITNLELTESITRYAVFTYGDVTLKSGNWTCGAAGASIAIDASKFGSITFSNYTIFRTNSDGTCYVRLAGVNIASVTGDGNGLVDNYGHGLNKTWTISATSGTVYLQLVMGGSGDYMGLEYLNAAPSIVAHGRTVAG